MQPRSGSLRRWLSRWLAMLTFLGLGGVCLAVYYATNLNLQTRQEALLQQKMEVIRHLVDENAATGDSTTLRHKLSDFFYGRPDFSLVLEIDGAKTAFGADIAEDEDHAHERRIMFSLPAPGTPGDAMHAELVLDITSDLHLRVALAWTLIACAFVGAAAVSGIAALLVRRAMAPWTSWGGRRLAPDRIGERLDESGQSEEIQPLVRQFNAVLQRLERAYVQIEGFNADVAHEMRTPLATLIGQTELALSGRRSEAVLRDVMAPTWKSCSGCPAWSTTCCSCRRPTVARRRAASGSTGFPRCWARWPTTRGRGAGARADAGRVGRGRRHRPPAVAAGGVQSGVERGALRGCGKYDTHPCFARR